MRALQRLGLAVSVLHASETASLDVTEASGRGWLLVGLGQALLQFMAQSPEDTVRPSLLLLLLLLLLLCGGRRRAHGLPRSFTRARTTYRYATKRAECFTASSSAVRLGRDSGYCDYFLLQSRVASGQPHRRLLPRLSFYMP